MPADSAPGLIVALDGLSGREAVELADRLSPSDCRLKVGSELFVKGGPELVLDLRRQGFEVFLDLKFHDIPNTVAAACHAAREAGVWMCTVHASGGPAMLDAAREAAGDDMHVVAVTALTSLSDEDLEAIGQRSSREQVARLARLAARAGLSGIVCSPREARQVREEFGSGLWIVTPGIRFVASADDQKRTATPREAAEAGASHLVVGRPVVRASDPPGAIRLILEELSPADGAT